MPLPAVLFEKPPEPSKRDCAHGQFSGAHGAKAIHRRQRKAVIVDVTGDAEIGAGGRMRFVHLPSPFFACHGRDDEDDAAQREIKLVAPGIEPGLKLSAN